MLAILMTLYLPPSNYKNSQILQRNCLGCHEPMTSDMLVSNQDSLGCVHCHATIGHGEKAGLGGPETTLELDWKSR